MAKKAPIQKLERTYNVPLRKEFLKTPKYKRAKKAVKALREFVSKHMKSEDVNIGADVNKLIWKHGIKNPPHHVKVTVTKEEDKVSVVLEGNKLREAVKGSKKEEKKEDKESAQKQASGTAKVEKKDVVKEPVKEVKSEPKPVKKEIILIGMHSALEPRLPILLAQKVLDSRPGGLG